MNANHNNFGRPSSGFFVRSAPVYALCALLASPSGFTLGKKTGLITNGSRSQRPARHTVTVRRALASPFVPGLSAALAPAAPLSFVVAAELAAVDVSATAVRGMRETTMRRPQSNSPTAHTAHSRLNRRRSAVNCTQSRRIEVGISANLRCVGGVIHDLQAY